MKFRFRRVLAALVSFSIILTMVPFGSVSAAGSLSNEVQVYNYLVSKMGLNSAAACGLLANVKAESNFDPLGDGDAGTSFGLFQWHAGRKNNLISYCNSNGLDYKSIEGQMKYLEYELKQSYSGVYNYIKSVENTADGAYDAGYYWCYHYEIPADRAIKADRRGETARSVYWKKYEMYKGKPVKEENEMNPSDYKVAYSRALKVEDDYIIGADVLYMQLCLYALGYNIEADGCYGPMTSGVVKRFQSEHGLDADGVCGTQTWNAIVNELNGGTLRITRQPQAVTAEIGAKVTFTVMAAGSSPTYQWYHKKSGTSVWTKWDGKTSAAISATSNESWNGMQVRCTVTDSSGNTVNSKAVTVTINISLAITQQPQSVTVAPGETMSFAVVAKGNGLTYQWYYKKADASDWTKWDGHTTAFTSATVNESWNGMQVRCTVADSNGKKVNSSAAAVTVVNQNEIIQQLEITQHPQSVTANAGDTVKFSVRATGSGLSYQWYYRKVGESWTKWEGKTTADISAVSKESWSGMLVRCMVADSTGYMENSDSATVTIRVPLAITEHPQSATINAGDTVKFAIKASGVGLRFQWYYKKAGASDWTKWTGHTTATTSATANESWNGMQVRCTVTDSSGGMVNSKAATVTIYIPLDITEHPQSVTAQTGDTVKFAVKASGNGLSYQWYYRKAGASEWTKWTGHTTAITSATANESWNGMQVRCTVTDSSGSTANSKTATVTINIPLEIQEHPKSVTAQTGDTVKFTVKASGIGLSYQWYYKKTGASSWTKWTGHTTASTTGTANESWDGMQVRCTVNDSKGSIANSKAATVSINVPIVITQQPQSVTSQIGEKVKFTLKATGIGLSYQWYYKKTGASNWTKWTGHTTASTTGTANESWDGMQVRCTVTDSKGGTANSKAATVTVMIPLRITQHPQAVTAMAGDTVNFSVKATGNGLSYQWYYKKAGYSWTKWPGHTTASTSATANESWNGMQVRCLVTDRSGNMETSQAAAIAINIPLAITQQPKSVTANIGDTVKFSVKASGSGLRYQWYYKKSGASSWTKWTGHTTASTSGTANESWNGMQVRCTVTDSSGSTVNSKAATVTAVIPLNITQHPQSVTASIGGTVKFAVKASGSGLSYQWYVKKAGASSWTKWPGHSTSTTSATANESWNGMQVRCTVTDAAGSTVNSKAATVTINLPLAITQHPQSVTAVAGDTVKFAVKASGNGLSYQWYYKKAGASSWTKWTGHSTATTSSTANESWNGMQVRCTVTDVHGSTANSKAATVTINVPFAITQQPQSVITELGKKVTFSVRASGNGLTYQWYYRKVGSLNWVKWEGHTTAVTTGTANESWNDMLVMCIVTDSSGSRINSNSAEVTVILG